MRLTIAEIERFVARGNITREDGDALLDAMRRPNKFGVAPAAERTWNGRKYASKSEMHRAMELATLVKVGQIKSVREQPRFTLGHKAIVYVSDFEVFDGERTWVEEVKGKETPKFRMVRRLWPDYGPCPLLIFKRPKRGRGWDREVVKGKDNA